jgi:hypothetical protein
MMMIYFIWISLLYNYSDNKTDSFQFNKNQYVREVDGILSKKYFFYKDLSLRQYVRRNNSYFRTLTTKHEVKEFINGYFVQLGDSHSRLLGLAGSEQVLSDNTAELPIPYLKESSPGLFVLEIPTLHTINESLINKFSQHVQDQIISKEPMINSLIIDLRNNKGGSYYAYISALSIIFPDQILFYNKRRQGSDIVAYVKGGVYYETTGKSIETEISTNSKLSSIPIVVLINRITASAGERLAFSLKMRPNTTLIGESTRGLMEGNTVEFLKDGSVMYFVRSVLIEPINKEFVKRVEPEIEYVHNDMLDFGERLLLKGF